jgi:hypothetical protein
MTKYLLCIVPITLVTATEAPAAPVAATGGPDPHAAYGERVDA